MIENNNTTVAKFGSELVTCQSGVDIERINLYVEGLVNTYSSENLVIVTSGAVAAGKRRLELQGKNPEEYEPESLAQLGSTDIMGAWEQAFDNVGVMSGGLLTTHHEIKDSKEGPKLLDSMKKAMNKGIVCVVNENDALSDKELVKLAYGGDNDGLASLLAIILGAKRLKLFTKKGGVVDNQDRLIKIIDKSNYDSILEMLDLRSKNAVKGSNSDSRGGMVSKLKEGYKAAQKGVIVDICATNDDMKGKFVTRVAA